MKHPDYIPGFNGTLEELAEKIGGMRYDANIRLDKALARVYRKQQKQDLEVEHPQVSALLGEYAELQEKRIELMRKIWRLCKNKPGMQE
jgi:hypothetical protein